MNEVKLLFFGDVYGRLGRYVLAQALAEWKDLHKPDFVVANVENAAHGKGVNVKVLQELSLLGIDFFTSGNHVFRTGGLANEAFAKFPNLIRPYNYGSDFPGKGYAKIQKGGVELVVVNLNGQTFFEGQFPTQISNPFFAYDELEASGTLDGDIILVDFHAEATSEKVALGWYLNGRASAVFGTHTHVPTADARILDQGTAYVTDVGMCGSINSVIGVKKQNVLSRFLEKERLPMEPAEDGPSVANAVLVTFKGREAVALERLSLKTL